jgi:pimeloyl-ACP methyl ester carboxylesterase
VIDTKIFIRRSIQKAKAEYPNIPIEDLPKFMIGHSMGGLVTVRLIQTLMDDERKDTFKFSGIVLSGPALSSPDANSWKVPIAVALSRVLPKLRFGARESAFLSIIIFLFFFFWVLYVLCAVISPLKMFHESEQTTFAGLRYDIFCQHPQFCTFYYTDPLIYQGSMPIRTAAELIRGMREAQVSKLANGSSVQNGILIFLTNHFLIVCAKATEQNFKLCFC